MFPAAHSHYEPRAQRSLQRSELAIREHMKAMIKKMLQKKHTGIPMSAGTAAAQHVEYDDRDIVPADDPDPELAAETGSVRAARTRNLGARTFPRAGHGPESGQANQVACRRRYHHSFVGREGSH
jgi:hypothetical protein